MNIPNGKWQINIDGTVFSGQIVAAFHPFQSESIVWKLQTWDKKYGSAQISIEAPKSRFRKVK